MTGGRHLEFGVAKDDGERTAAYRLRYEELVARGWGDPAAHPDGLERDEYDDDAVLVVARSGLAVVGTVRLVIEPAHVARLLPEYGIEPGRIPIEGTGVAGRFLIAPQFRRSREPVVGLLAALWRAGVQLGLRRGVTFQSDDSIRWCRLHGIPLKVIGPARDDHGERRHPILIDDDVLEAFAAAATDDERASMPARP